ncbi:MULTISPECIES: DUF4177 domain-containing protein [Croceitalea]|uniref:DUF4177 domain-containing protein n=1 Tax=Croceitalea vernalis TaxID=3075599 RepID=A0ABU3BKX7_9FLAO|nr:MULTISPECIES: DUF4177 domain-containing protein [unclassified Croceitalea]MDT0540836.1 DUF4177 domain-containing protein [Croceitalea sp. P059]MDT0622815.1 DUF4177 domain-containing protein [Croceitalea sp. P007]
MKEYKVVSWKMGLSNNDQRLENTLNEYAKQGWQLKQFAENSARLVFERDKNR